MKLVKTVAELQAIVKEVKKSGRTIGLVPTMGALHEGHASLIRAAHAENDFTIVSDFVNPTQFGPTEDLDAYPRTLDHDCELAEAMGADVLFAPSPKEMYPSKDMTWVEVTGDITKVLCGRTRPIHFRGVATVVSKLFNLAQPDKAYFGQKDAQQAQVLKRMVKDLFFPLDPGRGRTGEEQPERVPEPGRTESSRYFEPGAEKSGSRVCRRRTEQRETGGPDCRHDPDRAHEQY